MDWAGLIRELKYLLIELPTGRFYALCLLAVLIVYVVL